MPSSGDLQLSDSLRHDLSTILVWRCYKLMGYVEGDFVVCLENGLKVEKKEGKSKMKRTSRWALLTGAHLWGPIRHAKRW